MFVAMVITLPKKNMSVQNRMHLPEKCRYSEENKKNEFLLNIVLNAIFSLFVLTGNCYAQQTLMKF